MSVPLPPGLVPPVRDLSADEVLTAGHRETSFRYDLLDRHEVKIGELQGVGVDGELRWSAQASIKGGGELTLTDLPANPQVDWLSHRIRPVIMVEGLPEQPLGVWLPSVPVETWDDSGRVWDVELLDKSSILDEDIWVDPLSGLPGTYTALAGSNVLELVRNLITETGEGADSIEADDSTVSRDMTWDVGTTRLRIINDLLDSAGYFSLWTDHWGQFQATPYQSPDQRPVVYETVGAFVEGPNSVVAPEFTLEKDVFNVPNRFLAVSQGDEDEEALVSIATNTDPDSPFSYQARGRWITAVETDVEAVDQLALDTYAARRLVSSSSKAAKFELEHLYLPQVLINTSVRLEIQSSGVSMLTSVSNTTVPLDPLALCSSVLREVGSVGVESAD